MNSGAGAAASSQVSSLPPFLAVCRGERPRFTPVWLMRQAGRYLPEYRALRQRHDFLALMRTPELAAEVTLQPLRRFAFDAAILFADIMTPLDGLGLGLSFAPGPVLERPLRSVADIAAFVPGDPRERVPYVFETIREVKRELAVEAPLIGFAGGPFTVLCYLVEGRGSKGFLTARALLYDEPRAARELLDTLAELTADYLLAQAAAGADALMVFDSWVGLLGPEMFRELVYPATLRVFERLAAAGVPRLYFPLQGATLLETVAALPVEVVGIDWRLPLDRARAVLPPGLALQGNLDPAALFASEVDLLAAADRVLAAGRTNGGGHVFNLGHGVEPSTDPGKVALLIDHVHAVSAVR